jgi:hypothetical protein
MMMSGDKKSIVDDRWQQFQSAIDQYIQSLGLHHIRYNKEVEPLLSLDREQLFGMSAKDLAESAYILAQYSSCLQVELNKHNIQLNWARHNMRIRFGREASNYGTKYNTYEERKDMMLSGDSACIELNKMILEAISRVKQLEFLSGKVDTIRKTVTDIRYTREEK